MTREQIKELTKEHGCSSYKEMLVLSSENDPFYCGSDLQKAKARWFTDIWERFNYGEGAHLRQIHYRVATPGLDVKKHDGTIYENTHNDWVYLSTSARFARYLGMVDVGAFVDRRNPSAIVMSRYDESGNFNPTADFYFDEWSLPTLNTHIGFNKPMAGADGYELNLRDQPYHLELWVEKSTMEEYLLPICEKYQVNYVAGIGYQSITGVLDLLRRAQQSEKPVRIFYVSDFDPAGDTMPVAVARQIQFWLNDNADRDIRLAPLVLTKEQVLQYELPRAPIKPTDRSKKRFEETYGTGAVELDALEALFPGELSKIVTEAFAQYRDPEISDRIRYAEQEAEEIARAERDAILAPFADDVNSLRERTRELVKRYSAFEDEMEPLREEARELHLAIYNAMDLEYSPMLPERPVSDYDEPEREWLFDSRRGYLAQLESFKKRREAE